MKQLWIIFQTISKQEYFVGAFTEQEKALICVQDIVKNEPDQDYRPVDNGVWYGTTRKIELLPKKLDYNPVSKEYV